MAPETPGSIHEGGELGYSLVHAYGAAFDNPDLIVACVIGDGEAETGPLAASWHSNKFLNPARDGAVLPILHLNGYKIANPTVLARIPHDELESLLRGYGYRCTRSRAMTRRWCTSSSPPPWTRVIGEIHAIQRRARDEGDLTRPAWPMIVLRTPKGWTGPEDRGRAAGRGDLAGAPGAARRGPDQPGAPGPARGVDALLPAGGAVRRRRAALVPELAAARAAAATGG